MMRPHTREGKNWREKQRKVTGIPTQQLPITDIIISPRRYYNTHTSSIQLSLAFSLAAPSPSNIHPLKAMVSFGKTPQRSIR